MNKEQFSLLMMAIKSAYPREKFCDTKESMNLWFDMLSDLDGESALNGVKAYIQTEHFPPTIADIRQRATNFSKPSIPDWSEGWEEVRKAFGIYGYNREQEALDSFSEITRKVVLQLGWKELCWSENAQTDRANFRNIYQMYQQREEENRRLSPAIAGILPEITRRLIE